MIDFFSNLFAEKDCNQDFIETEKDAGFFVDKIIDGKLPFQNTTLTIRAYETKKKENPLRIKCKWYRVVDSRNYEIRDNNSQDSYHFNAYDIGSFIRVAIKVKGIKDLTILRFGPILLNERLLPELENSLLADEGIYNFSLLKYGGRFINDESDSQNFVKFSKDRLQFMFGFMFENVYENFGLDLNGPHDYKIICENHDFKAVSFYFKKGTEIDMDEEILLGCPRKKREYDVKKIEYQSNLESNKNPAAVELFEENSEVKDDMLMKSNRKRDNGINEVINKKIKPVDVNTDGNGSEFELSIRFKSRLERDAFIGAIRIITVMKTMAFSPLLDQTDKAFDKNWSMGSIGLLAREQYNQIVRQMIEMGSAIQRVLAANKEISKENQSLNNGTLKLENEVYDAIGKFRHMQKDVRLQMTKEQAKKAEKINKRMVDTSMRLQKMKEGGKAEKSGGKLINALKTDGMKAKGLAKQIESTNKLNALLLKEIDKLKSAGKKKQGKENPFKKKAGQANATMILKDVGMRNDRLNRSGIDNKQGDKFLLGLEERVDNNPFAKKMNPIHHTPEIKSADNIEEEQMLLNAIGNLQSQQNQNTEGLIAEQSENQEEDKMGRIVELELNKQLMNKRLNQKIQKFENMLTTVEGLLGGRMITEEDLEGSINSDIEILLEQQGGAQSTSQIKELHQAILLKYAESQCRQLDYIRSQKDPNFQAAVNFETFQPVSFADNSSPGGKIDEGMLNKEIEDLKEQNFKLENEKKVYESKIENLRKEVEKKQQVQIDRLETEENQEREIQGLMNMIKRMKQDNEGMLAQIESN